MRRASRRDLSESSIVSALEASGVFVWRLQRPVDLLCYWRGRWYLLEVKTPGRKRKDQESQDAFCKTFDVPRVTTPHEALQALDIIPTYDTTAQDIIRIAMQRLDA